MLARTSLDVLIVDDEVLIALDLADMAEQCGCEVIGPCHSIAEAFAVIERQPPDAAVLDINVGSDLVWPLAERLKAKGIPILFVSADISHDRLRRQFADAMMLSKPVYDRQFQEALRGLCGLVSQTA